MNEKDFDGLEWLLSDEGKEYIREVSKLLDEINKLDYDLFNKIWGIKEN